MSHSAGANLNDRGRDLIRAVRRYEFLLMGEVLSGWTDEELAALLPLRARFSTWIEDAGAHTSPRLTAGIGALRRGLRASAD
ncbi:MAG: hypothetical protein ACLFRZ_13190 [Rhodosalinus sp.]|uniref:hypothetical protein n=1 Tax=Rhodosalinus sp. TaxID=2047741 RepID=UPI003978072F